MRIGEGEEGEGGKRGEDWNENRKGEIDQKME